MGFPDTTTPLSGCESLQCLPLNAANGPHVSLTSGRDRGEGMARIRCAPWRRLTIKKGQATLDHPVG